MKKLNLIIFVLFTIFFSGCSPTVPEKPLIKISHKGNSAYIGEDLIFNIHFSNTTTPEKIAVTTIINETITTKEICINQNKIFIEIPDSYYSETVEFFVNYNGTESNHIELIFDGYSMDLLDLHTFINTCPNNTETKVKITGTYSGQDIKDYLPAYLKDETKRIILDLNELHQNDILSLNSLFENCISLYEINMPNDTTRLYENEFSQCTNLRKCVLPKQTNDMFLNFYSKGVFRSCSSLESIELPEGITVIPVNVFGLCKKLPNIKIPNSVTNISSYAFSYCENLNNVILPENLIDIGEEAFRHCRNISTIVIPKNVKTIDKKAFDDTNIQTVYFKKTIGWKAGNIEIPRNDLEDPAKAAQLLTNTYKNEIWRRSDQ